MLEKEIETIRLNSKDWQIGRLRNKYISKLVKKYGESILHDLNSLVTNPFHTLASTGSKYGVTREYIRQIVPRVYGYDYTFFHNKLIQLRKENEVHCSRHPIFRDNTKWGQYEAKAFRFLKSIGYDVKPAPTIKYDMVVNGYKVDIKTTTHPRKFGRHRSAYLYFGITKDQVELCDYFICHYTTENRWFVIPNRNKGNKTSGHIYIREKEESLRPALSNNSFTSPSLHENNWQILKRPIN